MRTTSQQSQSLQHEQPLVIAHRGASGEAPENTLAAFQLALEHGCDAVELDVRMSKDGHLIVCHDRRVDRTTNGKGDIHKLSCLELKRLDAGAWFGPEFRGERLPLLEEVFDLIPSNIYINIEVKFAYGGMIEKPLIELIRKRGNKNQIIISSFHPLCLYRLKRMEPEIRIGLLYSKTWRKLAGLSLMRGVELFSHHPKENLIFAGSSTTLLHKGAHVFPYTINDESRMKAALHIGVTGIITDYPQRLRHVLNEQNPY